MNLTPAQLRLANKLYNGYRIIRRGTTLNDQPRLMLKFLNGKENSVMYGTAAKLMDVGIIDSDYKLTPLGRKVVSRETH